MKKNMPCVKNCIRLHENELESRRTERRENGRLGTGEHSLKGVHKKLTPSPVTSAHLDDEREIISKTSLTKLDTLAPAVHSEATLKL